MDVAHAAGREDRWMQGAALLVLAALFGRASANELPTVVAADPVPVSRIAPGTRLFQKPEDDSARVLLFVRGRLAAGDLDVVTDTMRYYTELFNLVYTANVRRSADGRFGLEDVAVGFAMKIGEQYVAVTSESAERLGAGLSLVGSTVLSGNEESLRDITLTARNQRCAIIDAPSVVRIENQNRKMLARFFVWVGEADGRLGTAVWLLGRGREGLEFAEPMLHYLPAGMVEDRVMHVDKTKFVLGLPTADAFAMVAMPNGRQFPVTERLRSIGARPAFDADTLAALAAGLSEVLAVPSDP